MDLKDEIRKLIDVQAIDSDIYQLERELNSVKPAVIAELKSILESNKKSLADLEEEFKQGQIKKKEKEMNLSAKEEAVRKSQAQLYQLKTNKEYDAKLKEINSLKSDVSVIEEEILRIFDEIDKRSEELNTKKKSLVENSRETADKIAAEEKEMKEIESKINVLKDKRGILVKEIAPNLLSQYEHLVKNRQGIALVPLKEGKCGGCHMVLPAEVSNQVKQYKNIVQCEMCARMLYLEEDFSL